MFIGGPAGLAAMTFAFELGAGLIFALTGITPSIASAEEELLGQE
jgi:hypothetical protein